MRKAIPDASSFREPKAVPNKIVLARESRGWTQTNLADATKTTQGFVSRIENELSPAPLAFLE